jgi:opacity protein-like surface antigen
MKKFLTAIVLAAVAASPAMAAKARHHNRVYLQSDQASPYVPYGVNQQGGPVWNADPNIRDRLRRDYPDFH